MQKHVILSFTTTILLLIILGVVSVIKMLELSDLSDKLYKHPFAVTNATKIIESNLISMHRYMKDVVLSKNEEELNSAIEQVNKSEIIIYKEFDIVFNRYLGDINDIKKSYDAFVKWKPIRDEVIRLMRNGEKDKAAEITKKKGAIYVQDLNEQVNKLVNYAQNKAIFFHNNSEQSKRQAITLVVAISSIILFIVISMLFFLIKNLNKSDKKTKKYFYLIDQNIMSITFNKRLIITEVSSAFIRNTGFQKKDILGKTNNFLYNDNELNNYNNLINAIESGQNWEGEMKIKDITGSTKWFHSQIYPIFDDDYNVTAYTNIFNDISSKKQIEEISRHDGLTNLYNRRYFDEEFPRQISIANRNKLILVFIIIDIDNFKLYNDTYGHLNGDNTLKQVAHILNNSMKRKGDYAFRLGGEEFGMLFTVNKEDSALLIAEKIRKKVEDLHINHSRNSVSPYVTISMGVNVVLPEYKLSADEIYIQADEALYSAKNSGRNRVVKVMD